MSDFPRIAVIADAHFHDLEGDFAFPAIEIDGEKLAVRSWADTRESTRVFNESARALDEALAEVSRRGIRHVVLLGDYTDDGQRVATERTRIILNRHERLHGTRFYALPGNHDIFGPKGRHHTKQFLDASGARVFVTSDEEKAGHGTYVTPGMYCEGYPAGLTPMAAFGYFRRADDIHWETPFGQSDKVEDRLYAVSSPDGLNRYTLMDASYLVEPEPGLWLMMIDANVFEPRDGKFEIGDEAAFVDSTAAGWNALVLLKPFIIDWIADVSARAETLGKTLLAFSHYPVLDPFDGATGAEGVLFGETNIARRTPREAVAQALIGADMTVHFSGHLHVEGVTRREWGGRSLTNIAVPSLVAFPSAFKIVEPSMTGSSIETVELSSTAIDPRVLFAYQREMVRSGEGRDRAFDASDYGSFLKAHKRALVEHRYFPKEWPKAVVDAVSELAVEEVCELLAGAGAFESVLRTISPGAPKDAPSLARLDMLEVIADWYCLRQAAVLALDKIPETRRRLYRALAERFGRPPEMGWDGSTSGFLSIFFGAFGAFLNRAEAGSLRIVIEGASGKEEAA
ncbi:MULTISPECIES: metallophosphoesterase [unclassified Ensifer]|uniref:metallophosphoesterase family protein n=1 Tax=unclassified Ensifer TaxID=2633371 RepID=UPI000813AD69|nr:MULTISPECIES: metallophosphoesterase [unclassified Ensifer]OCP08368.1 metallophosphoesterase [Ensifer sp. LC11]OCP08983.1 metallophosphoesterase [Ensifer sp. LC13]OCP09767.1 metallophosphoesterase [Ensifer sp. LC14]OCP32325.1 metallophosphoesterase [Ensifer sp. LC499]